jgi:TPR repeat protein
MAPFDSIAGTTDIAAPTAGPEHFLQLGIMYSLGRSVPQNLVEAHKWFNIAAVRGNQDARLHRSEIARDLSAAEIADAQRQARAWLAIH